MTEHSTQDWKEAISRYSCLSEALADYYDCTGQFAPYAPLTASLVDFSRRSGITTTQALEQLYQLYSGYKTNRL